MHRFLQHINLGAVDAGEEIKRQTAMGYLSTEELTAISAEQIDRFLNSDLIKRMQMPENRLYREYKFMFRVKAEELYDIQNESDETILIQGIADAVIVESGGIVIVDYKTDRVDSVEELSKRYTGQLELYARALTQSFELPVKECILYSVYKSETISISV